MVSNSRLLEWVEALESGQYEQAREALVRKYREEDNEDGYVVLDKPQYCCLGVACALAESDGVAHDWVNKETEGDYLPEEVMSWLGISSMDPVVDGHPLSHWNDKEKYSFKQIARLIREKYNL